MAEAIPPMPFTWDGESMVPKRAWLADRCFVVGQEYEMVEHHRRSTASHNHYFAAIQDAFDNLPEDMAHRFPSADHLRKYALIRSGYRDERSIVCASKAEAQRVAAFMRPMDEYAVITVAESVVRCWTAKSQSARAMGKEEFQASKTAVLELLASVIGVEPDQLGKAAA